MPVKPQNTIPVLKDKLVGPITHDFSVALSADTIFLDTENAYELISMKILVTTAHIASQAVTYDVGLTDYVDSDGDTVSADTDVLVDANGTVAGTSGTAAVAAGALITIPLTNTLVPAGAGVTLVSAGNASQTGVGEIVLRLRPREKAYGNASKRPGASAQTVD